MAVPIVMFTMLITLALASAAVVASTVSHGGTVRDQHSKSALAAAEAGVNQALLHYNRIPAVAPEFCLWGPPGAPVSREGVAGDGWCREVSGTITGLPQSIFRYSVRPCARPRADAPCPPVAAGPVPRIEIVSTGTVGGVSRRVEVVANSAVGLQPFLSSASIIGLDSITVDSGGDEGGIFGDVATNGDITLGSGAVLDCDFATVGEGHVIDPPEQASPDCDTLQAQTELPAIPRGAETTTNHNGSFFFSPPCSTCWVDAPPNTTRQLTVRTGSALTLNSGIYSLCKLTLESNASLYVAAEQVVQIIFDDPGHCPGLARDQQDDTYHQLDMSANARMTVTGVTPTTAPGTNPPPGHLALLFVGSTTLRSSIFFSSNTVPNQECEQDFVVYAPLSEINISSNSNFCGAMAGKTVFVDSNSQVQASNAASQYKLPDTVAPHYDAESFVECSGAAGTAPNSGC